MINESKTILFEGLDDIPQNKDESTYWTCDWNTPILDENGNPLKEWIEMQEWLKQKGES